MTIDTLRTKNININHQESEEYCQFVTFMLAEEMYGISVHCVQSINEMMQITHVPGSSEFFEGVINLRGSVVPVINLRKRFNLPQKNYDILTVILIVESGERLIGLIVDSVSDVVNLPLQDIQKDIKFSSKVDKASVEGIAKLNEQLIIILNLDNFDNEIHEISD